MSHLCIYQKQPNCNIDEWAVQGLMEDNLTAFEETYLFIYIYVSFFARCISLLVQQTPVSEGRGEETRDFSARREVGLHVVDSGSSQ